MASLTFDIVPTGLQPRCLVRSQRTGLRSVRMRTTIVHFRTFLLFRAKVRELAIQGSD